MDLTSLMGTFLSDNSIQSVAGKTGTSTGNVASVMAAALPLLLNGANNQASQPETSQSFYEAVTEHAAKDPEKVDVEEGEKIVDHLLGEEADSAEKAIAKKTGLSKAQVALILAAAAPLIMNMLGNHNNSYNSNSASSTASLLGNLLGGSTNSTTSNALMAAALSSVLSNALGGNSSNNATSSILGSVLGSAMGATQTNHKPQHQINNVNVDAGAANLLGSLLTGATQQTQQTTNGLSLLGGLMNLLK